MNLQLDKRRARSKMSENDTNVTTPDETGTVGDVTASEGDGAADTAEAENGEHKTDNEQ